jgi:hypothetical protein
MNTDQIAILVVMVPLFLIGLYLVWPMKHPPKDDGTVWKEDKDSE